MKTTAETARILVVDDHQETLEMLERNLRSEGYEVLTAPGVAEAIRTLDETGVDLVVTDYKMPRVSGMDLIRYVRENLKNTEAMMITGYATVEGAVDAVKAGAEEYLTKPFTDEELFSAVRRALKKLRLRLASQDRLPQEIQSRYGLLGESEAMREVLVAISRAASPVRAAPARSWWRGPSTTAPSAPLRLSSPSTAAAYRKVCSRASCSGT